MATPHGRLGVGIGTPQVADVGPNAYHGRKCQNSDVFPPLNARSLAKGVHPKGHHHGQNWQRGIKGYLEVVGVDAHAREQGRQGKSQCQPAPQGEQYPQEQGRHVRSGTDFGVVASGQRNDKERTESEGQGSHHRQSGLHFFPAQEEKEAYHQRRNDVNPRVQAQNRADSRLEIPQNVVGIQGRNLERGHAAEHGIRPQRFLSGGLAVVHNLFALGQSHQDVVLRDGLVLKDDGRKIQRIQTG